MKILCIDTATEACSVALLLGDSKLDDNKDSIFEICPQQHGQRILPMIDEILTRNATKLHDLDAIAYGRGPGSFTGVRIASSTVQGLALGADLPVLEISTLQAMAQENYEKFGVTETLALIDARMSEVYAGQFAVNNDELVELIGLEAVLPPKEISTVAQEYLNDSCYVGTGFHAYSNELGLTLQSEKLAVNYPNAHYMLPIAVAQLANQQQVTAHDIQPVYLRDKVTWKKLPNRV